MLWCDATMVMWRDEYSNNNNTITNKLNMYATIYVCIPNCFERTGTARKRKVVAHTQHEAEHKHTDTPSSIYICMYVFVHVCCVFL